MASLFDELRRRNVFKVAAAYAIVSWLLIQIIVSVEEPLSLPPWSDTLVIVMLAVGFVVALFLAWAYELTPEGIKQTKSVPLARSVTRTTGRKLDFLIIGLLALAVVYMFVDNYVVEPTASTAAATPARSIAVLPFENRSALEEDRFFVEGIHDELLTHLAQIGSLDKVISRTSVMEYRETARNLREIGTALGVTTILEGGVQRAGERVRINVQLIDAASDNHLWSNFYDRELTAENIFDIQSEVAMAIADALQAALTPREELRLSAVPTRNTEALRFYLSGNDYFRRPDSDAVPFAVQQFERAVAEDPDFALAWGKLARSHVFMHWYGRDRTEERLALAMQAIERMRSIDSGLPELHLATGQLLYQGRRDYAGALEELALAELELPNVAEVSAMRAFIQRRIGLWEESVANMARAIELDPRNLDLVLNQAGTYTVLRDYVRADAMADRALEIEPDNAFAIGSKVVRALARGDALADVRAALDDPRIRNDPGMQMFRWLAALMARDFERATEILDEWVLETDINGLLYVPKSSYYGMTAFAAGNTELARERYALSRAELEQARVARPDDFRIELSLGEALAVLGETEEAVRLGRRALELFPPASDTFSAHVLQTEAVLRVFVPAGDYAAALDELEAYFAVPGRWSIEGFSRDPRLDPIREHPRFIALLERYAR